MNKTELVFLTQKYSQEGLSVEEIKYRLECLKYELKMNKPKEEKKALELLFKDAFSKLK